MSSSVWLLGVELCDFSHAEKERTACKAEQIHKMTTIFTQIDDYTHLYIPLCLPLCIASKKRRKFHLTFFSPHLFAGEN